MTDTTNISDFSYIQGLNLGSSKESFTYLYGLSDFWQYLFEDTETVNLLLEATSLQASDIYSNFLQLCSGISLSDITSSASSQLRLEIISDAQTTGKVTNIISGVWLSGVTTLTLHDVSMFSTSGGDVISVSGVGDIVTYDVGNTIDVNPIDAGGATITTSGQLWNGTYVITYVNAVDKTITYSQSKDPGTYTYGGGVTLTSIGQETYFLPEPILSTRFIVNRPFLPTIVLEENIDYFIDATNSRVSFARNLSSYGFPVRQTGAGNNEYSLWFVDTRYDEPLIYSNFPLLLGRVNEMVPTDQFRSFLYALYYIYTNGPTISTIEKGLNLVLGVPLARNKEEILDVTTYLNTEQYIVITDQDSYILPVGLSPDPTLIVGRTLNVGDETAKWVSILDSTTGSQPDIITPPGSPQNNTYIPWWSTYQIEIPVSILPFVPTGQSRLVSNTSYSYANWLMDNYLGRHSFLVVINASPSTFDKYIETFESLGSILTELKPNHTIPVYYYISSVPTKPVFTAARAGITSPVNSPTLVSVVGYTVAGDTMYGFPLSGTSAVYSTRSVSYSLSNLPLSSNTMVGSICTVQISKPTTFVSTITSITSLVNSTAIPSLFLSNTSPALPGNVGPTVLNGSNLTVLLSGSSITSMVNIPQTSIL
jgi:hypothetical protein